MFTISCNNVPWMNVKTREYGIEFIKGLMRQVIADDAYNEIEFSDNKGLLDIWFGEEHTFYMIREKK